MVDWSGEDNLRVQGCQAAFSTYPDTSRWFFEENRSQEYNAEAAELAWQRRVDFLKGRLTR